MGEYSPADYRAMTAGNYYGGYADNAFGFGGGNWIWFLALLFLCGGGFGGFGRQGGPVTEADLCNANVSMI